jgi:hypothetical protein
MMVLDTDIFIDHLRAHAPATRFLRTVAARDDVLFSAVTETELLAGQESADAQKREGALHLLKRWTKISLGNPIAAFAGDIRRDYGLSIPDAIIAATALAHNAELITRNVRDFKRIPDLRARAPY